MSTDPRVRIRVRRFVLVGFVLPVFVVLVGVVALALAWPSLPHPVAVHWGLDGRPDGFGPAWLPLVLLATTGLGLPALLTALTVPSLRSGDYGRVYPLLGAFSAGMAVFLTVLVTVSTVPQVAVADATDAPAVWIALLSALALGGAAGVAGWYVQPRDPFLPVVPSDAPLPSIDASTAAALAAGEAVVWRQRVALSRSGVLVLAGAVVLLAAITALTAVMSRDVLSLWIVSASTVVVALLAVCNAVFHVRVDDDGLSVTSAAGWPRVHVPLTEIDSAAAVDVDPMGEFGGWGMRWAPNGRFGIVVRKGPALEVRRRSGRSVTVTVDDAQTGAALLNALAARGPRTPGASSPEGGLPR